MHILKCALVLDLQFLNFIFIVPPGNEMIKTTSKYKASATPHDDTSGAFDNIWRSFGDNFIVKNVTLIFWEIFSCRPTT